MGENCAGWTENDGERHACQFVADADDFSFGGETYCRFHLPMGKEGEGGKTDWDDETKAGISGAIVERIDAEMAKPEDDRDELNFNGIVVPGSIDLSGKKLPPVSFEQAQFTRGADFGAAQFTGGADFGAAQFTRGADFGQAQFTRGAYFGKAQFTGAAHFWEAQFPGGANFGQAQFTGRANFGEAQFSREADFAEAQFSREADFEKAQFPGGADFGAAQFTRGAYFGQAQFTGDADFGQAQFTDTAYFGKAQFTGNAYFGGDLGVENAKGSSFQRLDLSGAEFGGLADFSNREFLAGADFRVRAFRRAPRFHSSVLHQDTAFPRIECFHERDTKAAARAYQTLRLAMENQRDRMNEGMFFALEQESRRRSGEFTGIAKWISLAYEKGSSYGLSIVRPLWMLFWIFFVSATIVMHITAYSGVRSLGADGPEIAGDAIVFSFRQSVMPFDALRQRPEELKKWNLFPEPLGLFQVLAAIQSVLSALAILLFILAVRWRYRR